MRWIVLGFCLSALAGGAALAGQAPGQRSGQQPVNSELIRLHDDLKLTDDQEGAWRAYTLAIAPSPDAVARHQATGELLPLVPTPRRLALIEATMLQDSLDFKRQSAAVNAFYGKLTPDQQKVFDRETLAADSNAGGDRR
ncbi:MAG TPA: Spy/CpxP family protein refolding chaperone [Phenylobacterium sp.]|nr:Spy/CpxP family protein refolding chaperone [Phenylobacterium sp.]